MEVELSADGEVVPGLASFEHGSAALAARENNCYSGERPGNRGLFHTGCGGGPAGAGEFAIFSLNTAIQAVGEGNYGRLGADPAAPLHGRRCRDPVLPAGDRCDAGRAAGRDAGDHAVVRARRGRRHGAEHRPLLDLPLDVHAGLGPLRHGLGGRAPAARRAAAARPRLARGRAAGARRAAERAGEPTSASAAARPTCSRRTTATRYTTTTDTSDAPVGTFRIGHTLPRGSAVASVLLDGAAAAYTTRATSRGLEVRVPAGAGQSHTLVVTAA